jgi:hypothetical protein
MTQLSLDYCVPMNFERPIKMHGVNKICPVTKFKQHYFDQREITHTKFYYNYK